MLRPCCALQETEREGEREKERWEKMSSSRRHPPRPTLVTPPHARPAHPRQTNNISDFNQTHMIPLLMDSQSDSNSDLDKRPFRVKSGNPFAFAFAFVARYWRLRAPHTNTFRWCSVYLGYLRHLRYFLINFHRRLPTASGQSFDVLLTTSRLKWGFAFESFFFAICRWLFAPIRNELKQVNQKECDSVIPRVWSKVATGMLTFCIDRYSRSYSGRVKLKRKNSVSSNNKACCSC